MAGLDDVWSGGKNVVRSVPILGGLLGLTSPEELAERRLQEGLARAGGDLRKGFGQAQSRYNPYASLAESLGGLQERVGQGGYNFDLPELENFQFDFNQDEGQQFAMEQGQEAIENMLSARGLTGSGREMKELGRFTTGLAGQQYGQNRDRAYREFAGRQGRRMGLAQFGQNQLQNQFSNELGLGSMGLDVIGQQAGLDTGLAGRLADLSMGRGQAGASRIMGQAKSTRGMLGELFKIAPKALKAVSSMGGAGGGGGFPGMDMGNA